MDVPQKPARRTRARKVLLRAAGGLLLVVVLVAVFELATGAGRHTVARSDGDRYLAAKNYSLSVERYSEAIDLRPDDAKSYGGRAQAKYGLDDWDGAIADAERAAELAPNDETYRIVLAAALNNRAVTRTQAGDLDGAVADAERAYGLDPEGTNIRYNIVRPLNDRGIARDRSGDLDGAVADLRSAARLAELTGHPERTGVAKNLAVSLVNRGRARLARGDLPGAVEDLTAAVEIEPRPVTRFWAAAALVQRGRAESAPDDAPTTALTAAVADFDRALELLRPAPANDSLGDLARAVHAFSGGPDRVLLLDALDARGFVLLRLRKDEAADRDFVELRQLLNPDERAILELRIQAAKARR